MTSFLQRHPVAFFLAVLAIVLGAIVAVEAALGLGHWKGRADTAAKTAPAGDTKLVPPMSATVAEQAYPETANRPLFTPTRRPAPAAPVAGNNMVKGQFTLQGVIGVGGMQIALLREKANGKMHRVEKGKEVNGVTLASVENDKVTLSQGGDSEVLALTIQKGPAVAAPPPPAPGAPAAAAPPPAAGPFGPAPTPPGTPGAPGHPVPAAPAPGATPPGAAQPPAANPATRSGFGPYSPGAPPPTPTPSATTSSEPVSPAMTPEELLARRRARRAQQSGQQPQN